MEHRGDELTSSGCPLGRDLFPATFPSTCRGSVGLFPAPSLQHEGSSARIWGQSRGGQLGAALPKGHVGTVAWGRFPRLLAPSPPLLLGTPRRSTGCCSSVFPPVKWAQQAPFPSRGVRGSPCCFATCSETPGRRAGCCRGLWGALATHESLGGSLRPPRRPPEPPAHPRRKGRGW